MPKSLRCAQLQGTYDPGFTVNFYYQGEGLHRLGAHFTVVEPDGRISLRRELNERELPLISGMFLGQLDLAHRFMDNVAEDEQIRRGWRTSRRTDPSQPV